MGDEQAIEVQEALEAPARGSADELLDAGAHAPIDAMRHSAAHVMAEAVLDLFPGAKLGIGPAIENGFYYDFDLPRPLTPDDLAAIEERMAASVAADHPFVRTRARRSTTRGRAAVAAGQAYKVEILDDLAARARGGRRAAPGDQLLRARAVQRPVQGPARRDDRGASAPSSSSPSPAPTGAATRSARCSSGSTARSGRPRRSWTSSCGGARRRRSATTASWACASTSSASTT